MSRKRAWNFCRPSVASGLAARPHRQACLGQKTDYSARMPDKTNPMPKSLKVAVGHGGQPVETNLQRRKVVVIGRGLECDIVIKDVKASRRHCQLTRGDSAFMLEDLGSKNGTFVEGKRITGPMALKPNQAFKIGDTIFYLS